MGAAYYLSVVFHWSFIRPLYGAAIAALLAALIIGYLSLKAKDRDDTVISAVWAVGLAIGILFIFKTPGYNQDLMNYLLGNILMVSRSDIWLLALLDILVLGLGIGFYRQLTAVCFDAEFARIRGIRVDFFYYLLLCLSAISVVILVSIVGIVMVIALLTLPAAIAGQFSKKMPVIMLSAVLISIASIFLGIALSFEFNLPAGAVIIILLGGFYSIISLINVVISVRK